MAKQDWMDLKSQTYLQTGADGYNSSFRAEVWQEENWLDYYHVLTECI